MVDFTSYYGGLKLKNPFVLASGPPTQTPECNRRAAEAGWAGVVLKTHASSELPRDLVDTVGWPQFRLADIKSTKKWRTIPPKKKLPRTGQKKGVKQTPFTLPLITAAAPLSHYRDEDYIWYANKSKELVGPDVAVIGSIESFGLKGWLEQCELIRKTKCDAVELNLSCPWAVPKDQLYPGLPAGVPASAVPEVAYVFTKTVVDNLDIPVMVKMAPKMNDPVSSAKAVQAAGAKGILWADSSLYPSLVIDIETGRPGWTGDYPSFSSCWGPWVISYTCGNIATFRIKGITIDLSASGGIHAGEDIIQCIMAGAGTVQPCRVVMTEGWGIVQEWLDWIAKWMQKKGYRSLAEIHGLAADRVIPEFTRMPLAYPQLMGGPRPPYRMELEERKCIDCGWCDAACTYCAIKMVNGLPVIDSVLCEVCGLCESVCPVGALSMVPQESPVPRLAEQMAVKS